MNWLSGLQVAQPTAHAVLIIAGIVVIGLALGGQKIRGVGLGVAGVLFAGIGFGAFHIHVNPEVLAFLREFGLILFVYTIGMQVGPGFLTSLRRQGLPLNALAASVVLLGAGLALLVSRILGIDMAAAVGIFAGATTNTPALGAAQEALKTVDGMTPDRAGLPALGYAVAYPFGILGIILVMLGFRWAFRIHPQGELEGFHREQKQDQDPVVRMSIQVTNENLNGVPLQQLPGKDKLGIIVSRVKYLGETEARTADGRTAVRRGDVLLAIGVRKDLDEFCLITGREVQEDLTQAPGTAMVRRFVVTRKDVLGRTLRELALNQRYDVTTTRVTRADMELTAIPDLALQFGDMLQVVGESRDLDRVGSALGNSVKELNHTNLIPLFVGIGLGVLLGLYPFTVGSMPAPVRLGLAGGPLLVAIVLSRVGRIGPLVWYMPVNANILLRELGIALFLASVGLKAGDHFFELILKGQGLLWMGSGVVITLVPLLIVGCVGRLVMKQNFINLCGLLSGSMTDPPALAFANAVNKSDAPSVAYATVYPFTMLLRILVAQLLVLFFCK